MPTARRNVSRRHLGAAIGGGFGVAILAGLLLPGSAQLSAPGRMNRGHEQLACDGCHRPAPGTVRQQIQANLRYLLALRPQPVDFGERAVDSADCLACHERPFDRHPVYRFKEPRFSEVRHALAPHRCTGCHREHSGVRVSVAIGFCVQCHEDLALRDDPLDVSHRDLIELGSWSSCLGCHDFHGNHELTLPKTWSAATPQHELERYFAGGASPYPDELRQRALHVRAASSP